MGGESAASREDDRRLSPPAAARILLEDLESGAESALVLLVGGGEGRPGTRMVISDRGVRGSLGSSAADRAAHDLVRSGAAPGLHAVGTGADEVRLYLERHRPRGELVVVGAGHIARPLATLGDLLDLRVTVLDDRAGFATRERFPEADRVLRIDFSRPFADVEIGPRTRLVLVTRGHKYDYECLRRVLGVDPAPAYLGMIGSRRRVRATFEQLLAEGFERADLARIRAPVGLDIGAETPEEIAVAVAAELVLLGRGGSARPLRDVERVAERFFPEDGAPRGVGGPAAIEARGAPTEPEERRLYGSLAGREGREPAALATVVRTRGSTPRKVGAKMLVLPGERLVGTVGGGCGEAEVIRAGREVLAGREPRIVTVDLTEDLLSLSPAVCGGILEVFVEPVESVDARP